MAWTNEGDALPAVDDMGTRRDLVLTSTSTVLVQEFELDGVPIFDLRMFAPGLGFNCVTGVDCTVACDPSGEDCEGYSWTSGTATSEYHVQYFRSSRFWHHWLRAFGGLFSPNASETRQVFNTCVPHRKSDQPWDYDYLVLDATTGVISTETQPGNFNVEYKDPQIVKLPEGYGWLMVLSRYRATPTGTPETGVSLSLGDIVAWWCPTADFDCTSVGPFLLVDSLRAWPGATIRLWLGTAGAALVGDQLLVYYTVEKNYNGSDSPQFDFLVDGPTYETTLTDAGFSPGVAVTSISWATLWSAITDEQSAPGTWTTESTWNQTALPTSSGAIACTPLGKIQVWVAQNAGTVRAFEDVYDGGGVATNIPEWADPAPMVCDGNLSLYLAGIPGGAATGSVYPFGSPGGGSHGPHMRGSGHGLWRCRAIADGFLLWAGGGLSVATFGVDFVVARLSILERSGVSPDQIAQDTATIHYVDPDPVQLPDGSWRVYAGKGSLPMQFFAGQPDDGCATADDLELVDAADLLSDSTTAGDLPISRTYGPPVLGVLGDALRASRSSERDPGLTLDLSTLERI